MAETGDDRPFLIFPLARRVHDIERSPAFGRPPKPSRNRQAERIGPRFAELQRVLNARAMALRADAQASAPEQTLVLELSAPIADFRRAVGKVSGLEWLAEADVDLDVDPVLFDDQDQGTVRGRLYLLMTNCVAMDQLLSLWGRYERGGALRPRIGADSARLRTPRRAPPLGRARSARGDRAA